MADSVTRLRSISYNHLCMASFLVTRALADAELQTNIKDSEIFRLPSGQEIEKEDIFSINECSISATGAQLGYFKGRGFVVEIGHKDIGFSIEMRHSGQSDDMSRFSYVFKAVKQ